MIMFDLKILLLILWSCMVYCDFIYNTFNDTSLLIGSKCFDPVNNKTGTCQKNFECIELWNASEILPHTVCAEDEIGGDFPIKYVSVCCPDVDVGLKITFSEANSLDDLNCFDNVNGFRGVMKFKKHCPEITSLIKNNEVYCASDICRDIVCCPVDPNKLTSQCYKHDNPYYEIKTKIIFRMACTVPNSNKTGKYSRNKCLNPDDSIAQELCLDRDCIKFFCCPELSKIEFYSLDAKSSDEIELTEIVSYPCYDEFRQRLGTCRPRNSCPFLNSEPRKRVFECGESGNEIFVCCPNESFTEVTIPEQKCLDYSRFAYTSTKFFVIDPLSRNNDGFYGIADGKVATILQFSFMAALGFIQNKEIEWGCAGSIISDRFILTAAHCLKSQDHGDVQIVRLGAIYLGQKTNRQDCPENFGIESRIPHPEYKKPGVYNDIALLKLNRIISFNPHVRPICLPSNPDLPVEYKNMGWGATAFLESGSNDLLHINQYYFPYEECAVHYANISKTRWYKGLDNNTQICLGSPSTIESPCRGDSGGPVVSDGKYHHTHIVYGVVSHGYSCGYENIPGIFTKVYPYLNWIERIVWN